MNKPALLSEYEELAGKAVALMSEENRHLRKTGTVPCDELLQRKRSLLGSLEEKLIRLRQAGGSGAGWPTHDLAGLQQRFLQLVRLDRENEKLLLVALSQPVRMVAPTLDPEEAADDDEVYADSSVPVKSGRWRTIAKFLSQ